LARGASGSGVTLRMARHSKTNVRRPKVN